MQSPRITVFFFHPFPRRSKNHQILKHAVDPIPGILVRDMYEIYPDFYVDADTEQAVLLETDILVLQHPFYWYSCPPLMKLWLDVVLEKGWAYGDGGEKLNNKKWIQIITTGGAPEAYGRSGYNEFTMLEFLRPFERTVRLCGMIPLAPLVFHGTHHLTDEERRENAASYRKLVDDLKEGKLPAPYSTLSPESP